MLRRFNEIRKNREDGFTLIELLVVMIIIGILAAVAIPIFLNQQKTARDSATTSDVKNLATNVQSLLVAEPDATSFSVTIAGATAAAQAAATSYTVTVGSQTATVSKTSGTMLTIFQGSQAGTYKIYGWNTNGKSYVGGGTAPTAATATPYAGYLTYNSENGGLGK